MKKSYSFPNSLAEGRVHLKINVPAVRQKRFGQYFSGLKTGRLLASLAVEHSQKRILDPMAGHGDLIESVAERAKKIGLTRTELHGVEIEPELARLCNWRILKCVTEFEAVAGKLFNADAFSIDTWKSSMGFDLVITNPPYIRYQTLSSSRVEGGVRLLNADATRLALEQLANKMAPMEEVGIWRQLIRSYSGLSDLSVPSWMLCGLLTRPGGVLALVIPQTWLNRNYARIMRYFFLRFFQSLAVVQESGQRWFHDAQVPASLIVGRRLSPADVAIPLRHRSRCVYTTPFAEIDSSAASTESHVGNAFRCEDPENSFAEWLYRGKGVRRGIKLRRLSWQSQRDEVLAASRETKWLYKLEGSEITAFTDISSSSVLQPSIAEQLPSEYLSNLRSFADEPIFIGQGLRTGCNPFFYLEHAGDVKQDQNISVFTHEMFGRRCITIPSNALRPALRKQSELTGIQIQAEVLRGYLLDLRKFVLPENAPMNGFPKSSKWQIMSDSLAEYVRRAGRSYLIRGEKRTLIPELAAVKPNGLGPSAPLELSQIIEDDAVRMWYMIPDFTPRHLAPLCVPRIVHDAPRAYLNAEPPVLIDANFSSIWCKGEEWSIETVFAILNSTWGELCMEALGTSLGGGALKLEAAHLRQIPFPILSETQKAKLCRVVRSGIDSGSIASNFQPYRIKIDQIIITALSQRKINLAETDTLAGFLADMIADLRAKRSRNTNKK